MEVEHADKVIDAVKGLNLCMDGLKKKEPEKAKFVDSEENLAARTKKIENSNMVEVLDRDNKKVIKKSSLKMPKKDNPNDIVRNKKHKRVIKFDVAGNAPKRYMDSNGNQVGGDGTVPKLPSQQRKIHVYEKHPMSQKMELKKNKN